MPTSDRPLTPREVADIFGVTSEAVREWTRTGKLASFRTPGGQRRFRRADVEAFLASHPEPSPEPEAAAS